MFEPILPTLKMEVAFAFCKCPAESLCTKLILEPCSASFKSFTTTAFTYVVDADIALNELPPNITEYEAPEKIKLLSELMIAEPDALILGYIRR